jgi:hypothetical protein
VNDGQSTAEPAVIAGERGDVGDLEGGAGQTPFGGLAPGQIDGGRRTVQSDRGVTALRQVQRHRGLAAPGVEDISVELALFDQRGDLRLRLTQAPRRPHPQPQFGGFAAVHRVELKILRLGHEVVSINVLDICQDG